MNNASERSHDKLSQDVIDAVESVMLKIIRDYNIYGMYGIAEIPDPNLSQLVEMLNGLKDFLKVLENLNQAIHNAGIVNSLINSQKKISLASDLLKAVRDESREKCDEIMLEIRKQR